MNNSLLKLAAVLSILFFLSTNMLAQETYNLQYKFAKGNTYLYNSDAVLKITQEVMGKETKINSDIHGLIRFQADDVTDNGNTLFTVSMDSATLKSNMMGKDTSVSLLGVIGKRIKSEISKFGEVKSSVALDTIDENTSRTMNIPQEVKRFLTSFPGKDIKIGDTWNSLTVDTTKSYGGEIITNVDVIHTLSGKENKLGHDCFKIPFTGKMKMSGKGNMQGMDFNLEGEGTTSGTFYFDNEAGLLIYSEGILNIDMTVAMTGQQGMIIPITQNLTYTNALK